MLVLPVAHRHISTLLEGYRTLSFLPLSHIFERVVGYYLFLYVGISIYFAESTESVAKNIREVKPHILLAVPRFYEKIQTAIYHNIATQSKFKQRLFKWAVTIGQKKFNNIKKCLLTYPIAYHLVIKKIHLLTGGNIKLFVSGGSALSKHTADFFKSLGFNILQGYGLTETTAVVSVNPADNPRSDTVGLIVPEIEIAIQNMDSLNIIAKVKGGTSLNTSLSSDEGEILYRGVGLMKGYWKNKEATEKAIDKSGWFHTGDIGKFDHGHLKITDRIKNIIINEGGKNIYPAPIEKLIRTLPVVEQVVIIGEKRPFLSSLIVPNKEELMALAQENQIDIAKENIYYSKPLYQAMKKQLLLLSKKLASHEKIRDFRWIEEAFTQENGLLTPSLKIRKHLVQKKHQHLIEGIYASSKIQQRRNISP